ncbi:hypothetical protein BPA01_09740 [Brevibacillus parabrevis]|uniref:Flagellar protein FliT n=2 Tax=Brevibacillus parabrevis TaxID=54914 RepID=A0A4Y3PD33_BREPA|nr:hypothetical protein BPA01_09740 [Brevibacillus parabrevis]
MDSEPDMWLGILAEREEYIGCLIEQGFNSLSIQKEYQNQLLQINEINQRLIPLIDQRKQGVQKQLNNVRRSKMATNSYQEAGPNGYGAFFDRKK